MQPTTAHPEGLTTHPERWTLGDSQNHMILLQIEEWFHTGLAGIKQAPGSVAYRELIIKPTPVGDLTHAKGHYTTPQGTARSEWSRDATGITRFDVTVPANTKATVYVPAASAPQTFVATGSGDARYLRYEDGYQVYDVAAGDVTFLQGTSADGTVGGTVPATLSLALGGARLVRRVHARRRSQLRRDDGGERHLDGWRRDAGRDRSERERDRPAGQRLVRAERAARRLRANTGRVRAAEHDAGSPLALLTYAGPVSNDAVTIGVRQHIGASQALAHRGLQQDADLHVVDDDTVRRRTSGNGAGRRSPPTPPAGAGRSKSTRDFPRRERPCWLPACGRRSSERKEERGWRWSGRGSEPACSRRLPSPSGSRRAAEVMTAVARRRERRAVVPRRQQRPGRQAGRGADRRVREEEPGHQDQARDAARRAATATTS